MASVSKLMMPSVGSFGPTRHYPGVLRAIAQALPLKHFIDLVKAIYLDHEQVWTRPGAIGTVVAWGAVGLVVALRRFRWEPREG